MKYLLSIVLIILILSVGGLLAIGNRHEGDRIAKQSVEAAAARGKQIIQQKNCGSCHVIPGVAAANGLVGPPLLWFARRTFVAGEVANTPENLARWIKDPRAIEPRTAMPNLGLSDQQASDVAAYLYTLK